jgi:hypothetical protein
MSRFLERYHERVGKRAELALVLSDLHMMADGRPGDPAVWGDWLDAVRCALKERQR